MGFTFAGMEGREVKTSQSFPVKLTGKQRALEMCYVDSYSVDKEDTSWVHREMASW